MDYSSVPLILSFFCVFLCFAKRYFSDRRNGKFGNLPPGPKPWPIFGDIFQLTDKPHRGLANLSKAYGSLMLIKLGSVQTLVVSSADMAKEIFLTHDLDFSSRNVPSFARTLDHNLHSVAWLPVSPKWRNLRKICALQLFSKKCLDSSQHLRQKKVCELLDYVRECCRKNQAVDIGRVSVTTTLNLLSNTLFSVDLASYSSASSQEFMDIVLQLLDCIGKPIVADIFPILSCFDLFAVNRDAVALVTKLFAVFDDMISERLSADPSVSCDKRDVLEILVEISKEEGSGLSVRDVKHLLVDLFSAGSDTTSSTLEWAMAELLSNPSKMVKAQTELDQVLGKHGLIQESDIEKLPYLQAVVKETFRLHPAAPLLVPRKAMSDVQFHNYVVPKNTQVLINVWAIGRDPDMWQNPTEFLPERFLERETDIRGQNFELMPFGGGRRICPGLPLAYRMIHLMVATLVHGFDWKLEDELSKEGTDLTEKPGITMHTAKPILAVPMPR